MRASIEDISSVQKRLRMSIPPELVSQSFSKVYEQIRRQTKVDGYRQGKAPLYLLKERYASTILQQVIEDLVPRHLNDALIQEAVRPVVDPSIELEAAPVYGETFNFSALIDIMPEINLDGRHKGLEGTYTEFQANDETIMKHLRLMARSRAKTEAIEDASVLAEAGHLAELRWTGMIDGVENPELSSKLRSVCLGMEEMPSFLEEHVIGMKAGESRENLELSLPQDQESLSGESSSQPKVAVFSIHLEKLSHCHLPEIDDELAKDYDFENLDHLRQAILTHQTSLASEWTHSSKKKALMDDLYKRVSFELPPALLQKMMHEHEHDHTFSHAAQAGLSRQHMELAVKRQLADTLLLLQVARDEGLEVPEAETGEKTSGDSASEAGEKVSLLEEKALTFLAEHANLTKTERSL
ncbi:MAG: trigger factor [Deltaproteobacteria bacterium]|nr:trigger factor [Deltaproteobacteria bacterium]